MNTINQLAKSEPSIAEPASQLAASAQVPREALNSRNTPKVFDLREYLEIPFVHKRLVVSCVLLSMLVGWLALLVWPRSYESETKLKIRVGRESVSLDPTATTSQTLLLQKTQEEEINSALQVIASRKVAEIVVEQLGPEPILEGVLPSTGDAVQPSPWKAQFDTAKKSLAALAQHSLLAVGLKDDISDRELAIRRIQDTLHIYAPKLTTVMTVHAESKTPEMAQAIAKAVTDAFLDQHMQVSRTNGSQDFFTTQSKESESQLNRLVDRKNEFMKQKKIVSVAATQRILTEQIALVDRDIGVAKGEVEQRLAEIDSLKEKIELAADEIIAAKLAGSDVTWSGMRQRVYELELLERNLAAIYTDDDPRLQQTRVQLLGAQEILDKLQHERVDSNTTPNPAKLRMLDELQQHETKLVGVNSILLEKEKQKADLNRQVNELLDDEQQLIQMDRDINQLTLSLNVLRDKQEEARVIDELQLDHISNISIFQPATFVERAVSPKKKTLAAAFVFLGLCLGFGLAFLRQTASRTLRTVNDVESLLGCDVISDIPRLQKLEGPDRFENEELRNRCCRMITDILLTQPQRNGFRGQSLGIIGVDAGCGASTLAAHLAVASSTHCGLRTILVDADAKQRSVSKMFGLGGSPGLIELLSGDASHDECLQHNTRSDVGLIACSAPDQSHRLTAKPDEIISALSAYRHNCDLLIIDLPPASQPDQAISLAQHLDSVLVVVESEKTLAVVAERLIRRLGNSQTEIIGVVLNKKRNYLPKWLGSFVATA